MDEFEAIWDRIYRFARAEFRTVSGLTFTYRVPGNFLRVTRAGREIDRSLPKTNFAKAAKQLPASGPGVLRDRQGPTYTWAILMDERIRTDSAS